MPSWTDTALPAIDTTVLPFMYQPKLPVENCFTSASISWPLMTTFSGSAFSMNCVSDTGQEVFGGTGRRLHSQAMRGVLLAAALALVGCGSHHGGGVDAPGGGGDDGGGDGDGNGSATADAQDCGSLTATLRDFQSSHPDFEKSLGDDRGVVAMMLGTDHKPVYTPAGVSPGGTISGPTSYDQWYRDVPGTNMTFTQQLPLTENPPGTFAYDNQAFFPLDGMGFPETFDGHNFHFTTEIHTSFVNRGGEMFTFTGAAD